MSKYIKIKRVLEADAAKYASMSNEQIAAELNLLNKATTRMVRVEEVESYLFQQGIYDDVISLRDGTGGNPETKAGKTISQVFDSKKASVDVNHASFKSGLDAIVASETISQTQADAIVALGNEVKSTEKIEGLGGKLYKEDIRIARAQ